MSKNVLIVLAHNNFRDEEYLSVRKSLENKNHKITVASTVTKDAAGSQGMRLDPNSLIDDISPDDFDAVVFIGGTGASQYWHDVKAHDIAKTIDGNGKTVAASSHATVTLAVAGILTGKNATSHVAVYEKLQVAGANYTGKKLEKAGNIITSTGANSAKEFAEAVASAI